MQINVAGMPAECLCCGNSEFAPLRPRPDEHSDKLACEGCGTEVFFDDLLSQVVRATMAKRVAAGLCARVAATGQMGPDRT